MPQGQTDRVSVPTEALFLPIVHDGDAIGHEAEDHRVPHALGVDRDVGPAGDILILQEVAEQGGILETGHTSTTPNMLISRATSLPSTSP